MKRLIPLFGVTLLAAVNSAPAFAGSYTLSAQSYKAVTASCSSSSSTPNFQPGPDQEGPIAIPTGEDYDEDPNVENGYQSFKTQSSKATATWVPAFVGEAPTPYSFKHNYDLMVSMTSYRNDPRAGAAAVGESYLTSPYSAFSSRKSGSDMRQDQPNLNYTSAGTQALSYDGGEEFEVIAIVGAKASTGARSTPGGTGNASASVKVTSNSITK